MKVLNVGGGSKGIQVPAHYADWQMIWLDINPKYKPDILLDARELDALAAAQYDAVYASHLLEHFAPHDLQRVLTGILHVLKPSGFAEFRVPDIWQVVQAIFRRGGDLYAPLYRTAIGLVTARDALWGYAPFIEQFGDAQMHRNGFTVDTLETALLGAGFKAVYTVGHNFEVHAIASLAPLSVEMLAELGIETEATGENSPVHSHVRTADVGAL